MDNYSFLVKAVRRLSIFFLFWIFSILHALFAMASVTPAGIGSLKFNLVSKGWSILPRQFFAACLARSYQFWKMSLHLSASRTIFCKGLCHPKSWKSATPRSQLGQFFYTESLLFGSQICLILNLLRSHKEELARRDWSLLGTRLPTSAHENLAGNTQPLPS